MSKVIYVITYVDCGAEVVLCAFESESDAVAYRDEAISEEKHGRRFYVNRTILQGSDVS